MEMPKKYKLVVSDLHVGKGRMHEDGSHNVMEDFWADRVWVEFLEFHSKGDFEDAEVELILNGDIFNTLQIDLEGYFSPIITESISLEKLKMIVKGHPEFFDALKKFASNPGKKVTYIIGNHDIDMFWDSTKDYLELVLDAEVNFKHLSMQADGVHYEHGQQYEAINATELNKVFLTKGLKEPILNLPWGSHFVINFIIPMKFERPAIDKVRPISAFIRWSFFNDTLWAIKTIVRTFLYFVGTRFSKSLYRTNNIATTFKIVGDLLVRPKLSDGAEKILSENPHIHTVIMGHSHNAQFMQFPDGRDYVNTGTWTEASSLRLETLGKHTLYTYALVDYTKNPKRPYVQLMEWRGKWHENVEYYGG